MLEFFSVQVLEPVLKYKKTGSMINRESRILIEFERTGSGTLRTGSGSMFQEKYRVEPVLKTIEPVLSEYFLQHE